MLKLIAAYQITGAMMASLNVMKYKIKWCIKRIIQHITKKDPLTGCYDYKNTRAILSDEIKNQKNKTQCLSVVRINIGYFMAINYDLGHDTGDYVLRCIGQSIRESVGKRGRVGRVGGDDFMIIYPGVEREVALKYADDLRYNLDKVLKSACSHHRPFCYFGIALLRDNESIDSLWERADQASYKAKWSSNHIEWL